MALSVLKRLIKKITPPSATYARSGFSAYGEDILAMSWFGHYGIDLSTITYVDVGAAHPTRLSNTYLFYQAGAEGILVEPDPDQAATLRQARPRDVVLNVGAAFDERRRATITRFTSRVFNTFSDEQVEFILKSSQNWGPDQRQEVQDKVDVDLLTLDEIAENNLYGRGIDFLSIDVESKDLAVLRMLDIERFKPRIICIEAQRDRGPVDAVLEPHGYVQLANTPDNFMYMIDPYSSSWLERAKRGNPKQ